MFKHIKTEKYSIFFDTKSGIEITSGINGYPDPCILEGPSLADIGIKGNCSNNDCLFCYQGREQRPDMSLDEYKRIVDELTPYTNQIALGGKGNPNSHINFEDIIEYTLAHNIVPNYTTSGHDLTEKQIQISKKCGAVAVSIANLQDYTFQAIKNLQKAGIKTNLHWVLSKKSIDKVIDVLKGYDVWNGKINLSKLNAIVLLSFKPQGCGKELDGWRLDDEDIKRIIPYLRNSKTRFKIGADSCLFCRIGTVDNFTKEERMYTDTCEASRCSLYISCDMNVMPCSYGNRNEHGVSLKGNTIKNIWDNSSVFNTIRHKLSEDPNRCPFGL